jgi:hypothetical protein
MKPSPDTDCIMQVTDYLEATHPETSIQARLLADSNTISLHLLTGSTLPSGDFFKGRWIHVEMHKETAAKLALEILRAFAPEDRRVLDPVGYDEKTGKFYLWDTKDLGTMRFTFPITEPINAPEP